MKSFLFLASLLFFTKTIHSQNVGINASGAAPSTAAMLDIVSADKGLLIPRVALTALNVASPITTTTLSLLIFNTATASSGATAVFPGYYYWDGVSSWVALSGSGSKDWSLTGNSGTTAGTNFLGTTDNTDLVFKVNSIQGGKINIADGHTFFGYNAGLNTTSSTTGNTFIGKHSGTANNAGGFNTAVGHLTFTTSTSGGFNTTVGYGSLRAITTGSFNSFYGVNAGANWTVANSNTGIGMYALQGIAGGTGAYNTALGYAAGSGATGPNNLSVSTGSYNTYIGYNATSTGAPSTFTNATSIGANAQAGANDVMVLGSINGTNGATADTKIGIGTTTPAQSLDVFSKFQVNSSGDPVKIKNITYSWPTVQGTANTVLQNNGSGTLTWADVYGSNTQYTEGVTDITVGSGAWTDMTGMSITFTPKHATVYVYLTASGDVNVAAAGVEMGYVKCRVTNSGATTVYGKAVSIATDYDDTVGGNGAWNCAIVCRVTGLTVGTPVTLKGQWFHGGTSPGTARCLPATTDYSHRTLLIID